MPAHYRAMNVSNVRNTGDQGELHSIDLETFSGHRISLKSRSHDPYDLFLAPVIWDEDQKLASDIPVIGWSRCRHGQQPRSLNGLDALNKSLPTLLGSSAFRRWIRRETIEDEAIAAAVEKPVGSLSREIWLIVRGVAELLILNSLNVLK